MADSVINRVLLQVLPFAGYDAAQNRPPWEVVPEWPARWLTFPSPPGFAVYRLKLAIAKPLVARIHVTADERYELYIDGQLAALGSERGNAANWFFESYDLYLAAGQHTLTVRVWALGSDAPWAQISVRPGFLLAAEDAAGEMLTTGQAAWESCRLQGITWANRSKEAGSTLGGGPGFIFDGAQLDPDLHTSQSGDWQRAELGELPATANGTFVRTNRHYLTPARLPPQKRTPWLGATLRHAAGDDIFANPNCVVDENTADASLQSQLAALVRGESCRINPNAAIRAIIDLGDYVCQYPSLAIAQGAGAMIRLRYAESLWSTASQWPSGNRNVIHGKVFRGLFDEIRADGREHTLRMPWWRAGRYVQLEVRTAAEELEIRGLRFEETRLALGEGFRFATNIPHLETIARVALRTLRMCSHETHMDCPYYEQLQYIGDTRLQVLLSFYLDSDTPLARKALLLMESSRRNASGLPLDSAPGEGKLIPPFALWWIAMIGDYARWRGDAQLIHHLLPGAREVMDRFMAMLDNQGRLVSGRGWNYLDVADRFTYGVPPGGELGGTSAVLHLHLVYTLMQLAELEEHFGIKVLSHHWRTMAETLLATAETYYWDANRQLFADDLEHKSFSQHAQVLAVLTRLLTDDRARQLMARTLGDADLIRCNIYFTHYLFEAASLYDGGDYLRQRLGDWHALVEQGYKTFPEHFGGTRSECHAWSAHVLFHILHTIAGIKPSGLGINHLRLEPNLRSGEWLKASVAHPAGTIELNLRMESTLEGTITIPHGIAIEVPVGNVKIEMA